MTTIRTPYKWNTANFTYNIAPTDTKKSRYTWDDVALVTEVLPPPDDGEVIIRGRGSDEEYIHPLFKDEEKKKRLIKLICKVQGIEYKEEKEIKETKVTVKDVKILAKEVLGINVKIL